VSVGSSCVAIRWNHVLLRGAQQRIDREFAHRFEHPKARIVAVRRFAHEQARIDQSTQRVERRGGVIGVGANPLGCRNGRAPGKNAETREYPSLGFG
jgi:hypothetical protein